jgi:hypothetical protein
MFDRESDYCVNLDKAQQIHHAIGQAWKDFVNEVPATWSGDYDLGEMSPIFISIRYGQNNPLRSEVNGNSFIHEAAGWQSARRYDKLRFMSFAIASHIRCVEYELVTDESS